MSHPIRSASMLPLAFVLAATAALAAKGDSKVIFVNQSNWSINELYFAPTSDSDWGEDHLGKHTLAKGDQLTLTGVACGTWDVRVVDEDGDECIVESVDLCGDTDKWVIKDSDLLACQAATE
ncbi:hypothetical protein [Dokdonella koreensis]|uniref:Secreted protein n=1 Tax=Dokdonella koreensis DS-123 TaxID=1300342 RepID=A0A160DZJ4_9GAMM|nr:hypothetical protein [Dokdonella koreensis]ANB19623.1 Hypothetical protein I596_3635 [Dokdonella koreensis DS-123]